MLRLKLPDKRYLKWLKQRITRGFDDRVTWSLDCSIAKFIAPRIEVLRDHMLGYPPNLDEETWFAILDKIRQTMSLIADFPGDETPSHRLYCNEGLDLLSEFFLCLWN